MMPRIKKRFQRNGQTKRTNAGCEMVTQNSDSNYRFVGYGIKQQKF